ncbi:MAG: hypothetical protein COX07_07100 [Bacteroidetes bacterium CG23_combo_of_CG06-09_8_20_14_all_32_9]|nr:MAG: hypothetical protein COX07_07100 [Bacteroidetes bacterium CG23_combo_of_CG06-09_8_20_14_all_32_9]
MKIINPIYDQAFKYLMENKAAAKKIISVITEEEILRLELSNIETTIEDPVRYLKILRMDFKAQIRTAENRKKTVLIELQKCQEPTDIIRFRRYLGKTYAGIDVSGKSKKKSKEATEPYPILAIYFLGYNIPGINTSGVIVDNKVIDSITKQTLKVNSEFINLLNHKSYIIQIDRLRKERKTRLEKLLNLFDQSRITDDKYVLDVENIDIEFFDIAEHLQKVIMDDEFRRKLELQEYVDIKFGKVEKELIDAKDKIKEKEKTIEDRDKTLSEKDKALTEKDKIIEDLRRKLKK